MKLERFTHSYFIGIGGIGMSAIARYFHSQGKQVSGYDKTPSPITDALIEEGITISFNDEVSAIPEAFKNDESTLVVYTPAIPRTNDIYEYFVANNFHLKKRSVVLGYITENTTCFAVAGTHGKTTTSSILAHLLYQCDVPMTAFLGGITENYQSNYIENGLEVTVVEADEFDRSFLTLSPDYACITSMDADHLDIYGTKEELVRAFKDFSKNIHSDGSLFLKKGLPIKGITYAVDEAADYSAKNIRIVDGSYVFDVQTPKQLLENFKFDLPGRHNLSNALIALAMAIEYGCAPYSLASALASFKGVKRRFSIIHKSDDKVFIDDYAHHPKEINAVYQAVSEMYPEKKTLVIFQPHLFTRTKDFADEFARSLEQFDEIRLLDIYPARELPIEGVTSSWLLGKINNKQKACIDRMEILSEIDKINPQVILTLGAGDIANEVTHIKNHLDLAS